VVSSRDRTGNLVAVVDHAALPYEFGVTSTRTTAAEALAADGDVTRAVALDPCNGCRADARYLTVATGRDYADVAPTSGTYSGPARGRLTATKQVGLAEAA
jgi:transglutaminase-like putative cysteine protease